MHSLRFFPTPISFAQRYCIEVPFPGFIQSYYDNAFKALEELKAEKALEGTPIDTQSIENACELGAGSGESSIALLDSFNLNPEKLIAVEKNEGQYKLLKKSGILPTKNYILEDGCQYLQKNPETFDLIYVSMTWLRDAQDINEFLDIAFKSLTSEGILVMTIDDAVWESPMERILKQKCRYGRRSYTGRFGVCVPKKNFLKPNTEPL